MISNNARVARGLYLLRLGLDSYVSRQFTSRYADRTAPALEEILGAARDEQRPFLNMKAQEPAGRDAGGLGRGLCRIPFRH